MILKDFFSFIPGNRKITSHFHEFMTNTHKTLHRKQGNNRKSSIQMFASQLAKEYDFLLLDELQINNIADAMIVGRLFKAIIEAGVIVFFTSNRHPDDLFKNGLHRDRFLPFIDFIKQKLQIFSLDGDIDYRMRDFNFHNAYFINKHIAIANTELEQELKLLIGDHKTFPQTISLYENRSITIHNTLERIAIFSFAQICETEMGVLDYLGICNHFNIIIIKNIPQFSENMHNEALRFITLIDCLYENHVKLMASFHSPIEELCSKGKHAFEFSRTISRLQEMQTSKYFKSYRKIDDTKYALDAV